MFYITFWVAGERLNFVMDLSKPFELFANSLGTGLGIAFTASFIFGYAAAFLAELGLFRWIDRKLFWAIKKYSDSTHNS